MQVLKMGHLCDETLDFKVKLTQEGPHLNLQYKTDKGIYRINILKEKQILVGRGVNPKGQTFDWSAQLIEAFEELDEVEEDTSHIPYIGEIWFPNMAYGWQQQPRKENIIFRNATVWTNEDVGTIDKLM